MGIILDQIPGVSTLERLTKILDSVVHDVESAVASAIKHDPLKALESLLGHIGKTQSLIEDIGQPTWAFISKYSIGELYREMLVGGLGLDYGKVEQEAQDAVKTVDTMLGFALFLPLAFSAVESGLKLIGAQRVAEGWSRLLGRIPEEIGITWALGQQIDRAFETAVGTAIEEAINQQKHPTRLEWPVLRQLFRQRLLNHDDACAYLDKLGYPDELKDLILRLDTAQLNVGDLQNLWRYDVYDRKQVRDYLGHLGYTDVDADNLTTLYIDKAELTSAATLHSTARTLYRSELIDEATYRTLLTAANVPDREVSDDIIAVQLEQKYGRIATTVSALKTAWQHGSLDHAVIIQRLAQLGYSGQAISDLTSAWGQGRLPHPMSQAKVLTYWYSGVITNRDDAYTRLVATGLRSEDANFLLDHPTASGARVRRLSPALVTQAYLDGVIPETSLSDAYAKAGLAGDTLQYQTRVATFKRGRQKRQPGDSLPLSAGDIREGYKYGIETLDSATAKLEHLGYSADDAFYLLELTSKGPIDVNAKQAPAAFPNVGAALAFLIENGFTVIPPPNPLIAEAESLVQQAGYTVIAPITPPPSPVQMPGPVTPPLLPSPASGA